MNDASKLGRELTYEIADGLAQASSLILELRIALRLAAKPGDEHADEDRLEQLENQLDQMVILFRAYGIYLLGQAAQAPIAEINDAIAHARQNLKKVTDLKHHITTATRLVELGAAILSRDPLAMVKAARSLHS
ncbi:hypothetical protein [Janthinobacterium sp.]|uniref:hypothetical protein n=1 Tax=Janthinobacterium sp. TaxID=1871054 RepID=UPI00289908A0|nr:hypothetical protein [Janthinobacterium sp.]